MSAYRRIENFVERATEVCGDTEPGVACAEFVQGMDDDLGVPQALAAIHTVVREGNTALADGAVDTARGALAAVLAMTGVLGISPRQWGTGEAADLSTTVDALVRVVLDQRADARVRKDYAASDAIRDSLAKAGVSIEDTPDGPRWSVG